MDYYGSRKAETGLKISNLNLKDGICAILNLPFLIKNVPQKEENVIPNL